MNSRPLPYQGSALPLSYTGVVWSGRRGSNPRPSAWKADALPTELLPLFRFFWPIAASCFASSVGHYRKVTPSLLTHIPCTEPKQTSTLFVVNSTFQNKSPIVLLSGSWWEKMDSNHRRYKPADLQSAPFGHSGILPFLVSFW